MKMTGLAEFGASLYCGDGREAHWIYWCCTEHNHLARSLCPRSTRPLQTTVAAIIRHRKENNRLPFFGSAGDSRRTRIQYIYSPIYPYSKKMERKWKMLTRRTRQHQSKWWPSKEEKSRSFVCVYFCCTIMGCCPTNQSFFICCSNIYVHTHVYNRSDLDRKSVV